ncbi:MAG: SpvB/TcaC N-terminal domain-containing protein [Candidatus Aminicenantes bacterium]|jgi:RHS repeat-associated protein
MKDNDKNQSGKVKPSQQEQTQSGSLPSVTLPKGGGAVKGIEEKFEVNPVNGTAALSFPLPVSPARDFSPALVLRYNSGAGNGPFGLGWRVTVPSISRKTEKKLPRYDDITGTDTFILSDAEDLVPVLKEPTAEEDSWQLHEEPRDENGLNYRVRRYRPRIEGLFARIERWQNIGDGMIHWRTISRDNVTSIYGKSPDSRIADPQDPGKIYQWLLEFTYNDKGDCINYVYKSEDLVNVNPGAVHEKNRLSGVAGFTNRYLKKIQYGNKTPYKPPLPEEPPPGLPEFMFETVLDYGEHDATQPLPDDTGDWLCRTDAFSTYRPGFEVRSYRLCQRVLLFHHFAELGGEPCLVRSMDFTYKNQAGITYLEEIVQSGYIKQADGTYVSKSLPPLVFSYQSPRWNTKISSIDKDQLDQAPRGIDNRDYQWIDLYGEGISGILAEQENAWFYKRNLGNGHFTPGVSVVEKPSFTGLSAGNLQVQDLEANGKRFLVCQQEPVRGFFEMTAEEEWLPFRPFEHMPNINFNDPNLKYIDLDGDRRADILISENQVFCWYACKGKDGYGDYREVPKVLDEEQGPVVVFADSTQSIMLADMNGDGLTDIVRIRNGQIVYWPNLGYGRFGAKVTMSQAPLMDSPELFNPRYIRLADLDGSGTMDLIYLGEDQFRCWLNADGNTWSQEPLLIDPFPKIGTHAHISVIDLLGTGTSCIVHSSPLDRDKENPLQYIDVMDSRKPHLLASFKNNLGKEIYFQYKSSTHFYLEDKKAGTPWITKLPFPVHCVSRVEVVDGAAGNRFVNEYTYHHGYYDYAEREFRGFGRVDQLDSETFEHFVKQESGNVVEEPLHQPPVLTKTWFHTGAFISKDKILNQFAHEYYHNSGNPEHPLPEPQLPHDLTTTELIEALRACKGMALRREVYARDGTEKQDIPYNTTRNNFLIRKIQPGSDNPYASFLAAQSETITYHYERNPADPRINHTLNLQIDELGNVEKAASVVYPRQQPDTDLPLPISTEQQKMHIIYTETDFTADIDINEPLPAYRLRLPFEVRTYELTGTGLEPGEFFTLENLETKAGSAAIIPYQALPDGTLQKKLVQHSRTLYLGNDLSGPLPVGQLESLGLTHETYILAFSPGLISHIYGTRLPEAHEVFSTGGYVHFDGDTNWWLPSGTLIYPEDAPERFYLPVGSRDPLGNISSVTYDDYHLLAIETRDALENITRAEIIDYRVLQPKVTRDANQNRIAVGTDELGMVIKTAVMGKQDETAPENRGDTLEHPTTRLEYDLFNWKENQKPIFVHTSAREKHGAENSRWQESYAYSDGSGNVLMTKVQAEPGLAKRVRPDGSIEEVDTTPNLRWVGSGRTILNNKGNPVKKYEPYFSTAYEYEAHRELVEVGVTPVMYYDPPGRLIKTVNPNGTFSFITFDPWKQQIYDENDTAADSPWYAERGSPLPSDDEPPDDPERRAAWLAAKHHDSPTVLHLDSLGRSFYSAADNKEAGQYTTFTVLDIEGQTLKIIDARENDVVTYRYSIDGQECYQNSMDGGERRVLNNAVGNPILNWDSRGHCVHTRYDQLQRPTHVFLSITGEGEPGEGEKILVTRTIYGEAHPDSRSPDPDTPPPCRLNLRGQVFQQYDGAGRVINQRYDFKGNLLEQSRRLATLDRIYRETADWRELDGLSGIEEIGDRAEPFLEKETFMSGTSYDALNRPALLTNHHDNSMIRPTYNEAGLLEAVQVRLRGAEEWTPFVANINYNARGQRVEIGYGPQIPGETGILDEYLMQTRYQYDPYTFHLKKLTTLRQRGESRERVQDLSYTYDPVGNITQIQDDAQPTIYYNNEEVEAHSRYEYDALYRLVKARGREHIGADQPIDNWDRSRTRVTYPWDRNAMRNYCQEYVYDAVGNILRMIHQAGNGHFSHSWTREFAYEEESNQLRESRVGELTEPYGYDPNGNMQSMLHLGQMNWNFKDQLYHARAGVVNAWYTYDSQGQRVRKVVEKPGGIREERIYFGGFEIYRETQGETLELERETLHIMDDQKRIALVETKTIDIHAPPFIPNPIIRYQLSNHLGNACLELDAEARIISYEEYYPYGSTSYQAVDSEVDVSAKRFRFAAMERDEETGLNYHTARYYAPWLGRWTGCDPAGLVDGTNLYIYSLNNPVNFEDSSGKDAVDPFPSLGPTLENDEIEQMLNQVFHQPTAPLPSSMDEQIEMVLRDPVLAGLLEASGLVDFPFDIYISDPSVNYALSPRYRPHRVRGRSSPGSAYEYVGQISIGYAHEMAEEHGQEAGEVFIRLIGELAEEGGGTFGQPGTRCTFDPSSGSSCTAYGVFQWQRFISMRIASQRGLPQGRRPPYQSSPFAEIALPISEYARQYNRFLELGASPQMAARHVFMWHSGGTHIARWEGLVARRTSWGGPLNEGLWGMHDTMSVTQPGRLQRDVIDDRLQSAGIIGNRPDQTSFQRSTQFVERFREQHSIRRARLQELTRRVVQRRLQNWGMTVIPFGGQLQMGF